jgi:beta-lactamase class A
MMSRRALLFGLSAAGLALPGGVGAAGENLAQEVAAIEQKHGGHLGVAIFDTATMAHVEHRGSERFPMCSTYKFLSVACTLARVDRREESLARRVTYSRGELVAYSPVTEKHVGDGMTVAELCEAALTVSDNTAANLLLASFGGPPALTTYLRSLGDDTTRLDRYEPELNEAAPGDPRDTTTPAAMTELLRKLALGSVLLAESRAQITAWLVACKTGDKRLRAGVPTGWRVGDKTGSGGRNATNDIAVVWPPGRAPVIVTSYYIDCTEPSGAREAALAEVGQVAAAA